MKKLICKIFGHFWKEVHTSYHAWAFVDTHYKCKLCGDKKMETKVILGS